MFDFDIGCKVFDEMPIWFLTDLDASRFMRVQLIEYFFSSLILKEQFSRSNFFYINLAVEIGTRVLFWLYS